MSFKIIEMYPQSFRVFQYGEKDSSVFREVGLIDVLSEYKGLNQRTTLGFYRSSGTNSGKIKGTWYPIVGIKETHGLFDQGTVFISTVHNKTVQDVEIGWLMKSIFFKAANLPYEGGRDGFSHTSLAPQLQAISKKLFDLYESSCYHRCKELQTVEDFYTYNDRLYEDEVLHQNSYTQSELFETYFRQLVSDLMKTA